MSHESVECKVMDCIKGAQEVDRWGALVYTTTEIRASLKTGNV
jgi:hypothetical protein